MSMHFAPIGNVVEKVSTWNPTKHGDGEFDYIELSSVDQCEKRIATINRMPTADAPSRARQIVQTGDVLVSTVRPNLNGVAKAVDEHDGMTASTGFCVLRPIQSHLDSDYLFQWVRSHSFVGDMMRKATGASYPAVSDRIVKDSEIPLPPLNEQKRIAAILVKADQLRQKRRQAIALLDSLTQSIFLEMFGDPATNPKSWPVKSIGDLLDSANYGTSGKAGADGEFPILRMGNVTSDGRIDVTDLKYIDLRKIERPKYTIRRGDLLFNRTNSADLVGKTAVFDLDDEFAFAGYLVRARTNKKATPEFISAYLNSSYGKALLRGMAKSIVGMANINAKEMQGIAIPAPPIELQRQFSEKLDRVKKMRQKFLPLVARGESLFFSLQHRAFSGQL